MSLGGHRRFISILTKYSGLALHCMSFGGHRRFISTLMNAYGFAGALNRVGFVWTSFFHAHGLEI